MTKPIVSIEEKKDHYLSYELEWWKKITAKVTFHNKKFTYFSIYPSGKTDGRTFSPFFGSKKFKVADIRIMGQRLIDFADQIEADIEARKITEHP